VNLLHRVFSHAAVVDPGGRQVKKPDVA